MSKAAACYVNVSDQLYAFENDFILFVKGKSIKIYSEVKKNYGLKRA